MSTMNGGRFREFTIITRSTHSMNMVAEYDGKSSIPVRQFVHMVSFITAMAGGAEVAFANRLQEDAMNLYIRLEDGTFRRCTGREKDICKLFPRTYILQNYAFVIAASVFNTLMLKNGVENPPEYLSLEKLKALYEGSGSFKDATAFIAQLEDSLRNLLTNAAKIEACPNDCIERSAIRTDDEYAAVIEQCITCERKVVVGYDDCIHGFSHFIFNGVRCTELQTEGPLTDRLIPFSAWIFEGGVFSSAQFPNREADLERLRKAKFDKIARQAKMSEEALLRSLEEEGTGDRRGKSAQKKKKKKAKGGRNPESLRIRTDVVLETDDEDKGIVHAETNPPHFILSPLSSEFFPSSSLSPLSPEFTPSFL